MYATFQTQGYREYMEDYIDIEESFYGNFDFYAVYDGHGGHEISLFLKQNLKDEIKKSLKDNNPEKALYIGFHNIARKLSNYPNKHVGSTALVMLKNKKDIWIANTGDCRAILKYFDGEDYEAIAISEDHKPNTEDEKKRIYKAGGFIAQDPYGTWRVGGNLAVSRSFGDLYLTPAVTWEPEIYHVKIKSNMRAVVLASDGIWDTLSNKDVVTISSAIIKGNMSFDPEVVLDNVCKNLSYHAQSRGSGDNISVIFVTVF